MLSWTGTHGNMTFNQTLHYINRINLDDIVLTSNPFTGESEDKGETVFTIANKFCKLFEINPSIKERLGINLNHNDSFAVIVNDPVNTNNLLFSQMSGDKILYDDTEKKLAHYLVKFKLTQDKTGGDSCADYPTSHYQSLSQCIKEDIVKRTISVFGFGLPFFSETNQKPLQRLKKHEHVVDLLESIALNAFGGKIYRPEVCLPPCTILTATSEQQQLYSFRVRRVTLNFDDLVQVQTTVIAYGVGSLLVEVGSSLGLWLGLSVVGVFDLLTSCLTKMVIRVPKLAANI